MGSGHRVCLNMYQSAVIQRENGKSLPPGIQGHFHEIINEKKLKEGITTWTLCSVTRTSVGKSQRGWTLYTDKRCDERQAGDSSGALSGKSSSPVSLQLSHSIQHSELLSSDPEKHTFHSTSYLWLSFMKPETRIIFKVARENELSTMSQHNAQLQVLVVTLRAENERFLNLFHNN